MHMCLGEWGILLLYLVSGLTFYNLSNKLTILTLQIVYSSVILK